MFSRAWKSRSGSAAVEFAIVAPVLLVVLFGIIAFAILFATYSGVQQLAAEAARAAVPGISQPEREALVRDFVTRNVASYPLIKVDRLTIDAQTLGNTFKVTLTYDNSASVIYALPDFVPLPGRTVVHTAAIQRGGY